MSKSKFGDFVKSKGENFIKKTFNNSPSANFKAPFKKKEFSTPSSPSNNPRYNPDKKFFPRKKEFDPSSPKPSF